MPPRWHWLRLRTTCHPTEDLAKVRAALQHCTALGDEEFDSVADEIRMESHHGGTVVLLEVALTRAREVRAALALLGAAEREELACAVEPRTDEDGVFHFRFSKQDAFAGATRLTRGDDCVQLRLKPEVHPSSRDAAVVAVASWLQGHD